MRVNQALTLPSTATPDLRRGGDGWIRPLGSLPRPRKLDPAAAPPEPPPVKPAAVGKPAAFVSERGFPKVELLRSPRVLLLRAALPGVRAEDLRVRLDEGDLVIEGELRPVGDEAGCRPLISEWCYGPFHRRIQLGGSIEPSTMTTELRDGLLRVEIQLAEARRTDLRIC